MIHIRPATDHDFDAIWRIFQEVVAGEDSFPFYSDTGRDYARRFWMEQTTASYVACDGDDIAGSYYIKPNQPGLGAHVCNAGYMVSERVRGHGIGRAMCAHSLREARRLGFLAMQFNMVVSTNTAAVRLWQDMGFSIVGTVPKAFKHREHGYVDVHIMYQWLAEEP